MMPSSRSAPRVPWRTILAIVGIVLGIGVAIELVLALRRTLIQLVIALFFAAVLNPAIELLQRHRVRRRGLATGVVFLVGLIVFSGLGYLFVHPIYSGARHLADDLPGVVARTEAGKGPVGKLVTRFHLEKQVRDRLPQLRQGFAHAGKPAVSILGRVASGLADLVTILVLTVLILIEAPGMVRNGLAAIDPVRADRIRHIGRDVGRSVSGYVLGNASTSFIAGVVCGLALVVMGVPFAFVFAVWVAMVDFLPLVGGLLAGVPTVAFAFLHSTAAGITLLVVFLVYQQVENHILNPLIMSKTVQLNPLWVLLSVLAGAELAGFIGALLAIPAAGAIQVVARDVWDNRRGQLKQVPTVGPDEAPTDEHPILGQAG